VLSAVVSSLSNVSARVMLAWLRSMLHRIALVETALAEPNMVIAACRPWAHQPELLQTIPGVGRRPLR
jgi:hypothetical protein